VLAAVIPARDEEATIAEIVEVARRMVDAVFVVDDGSSDATDGRARAAGAEIISIHPGAGYAVAVLTGIRAALGAGAERVVTLDAGGSHDPYQLRSGVHSLLTARNHAVIGARVESNALWWRKLLSEVTALVVSNAVGQLVLDATSGYRWYARGTAEWLVAQERFARLSNHSFNAVTLIAMIRAGFLVDHTPITYRASKSTLTWRSTVRAGLEVGREWWSGSRI